MRIVSPSKAAGPIVAGLLLLACAACAHETPPAAPVEAAEQGAGRVPAPAARQEPAKSVEKLELRLVADAPGAGTPHPVVDGTTLRLEDVPIVTTSHVSGVKVLGADVNVILNEAGAAALLEATRNNVGRRIAIVVDGTVQVAPVVRAPIGGGRLGFTASSPAEAEGVAARLSER